VTPERLACLHNAAFTSDRSWSADEFSELLDARFTTLIHGEHGFAFTRTLAGETELLTLAVDPAHQRRGIARCLLNRWLNQAAPLAEMAFLEVAADNVAAISLYRQHGFETAATRKAYYSRKNAQPMDACIMRRALT
jgi:ribosomal-protein-alanine N-acetyltransferase